MNDYYEVKLGLHPCSEDATDLMAAFLGDIGYESFVPGAEGLTAYVRKEDYNPEALQQVIEEFPIKCTVDVSATLIPGQDWNAEWEKHYFQPIVVGDECVIHSSFHTDVPQAKYDIVIDPKMAFGTGHHATTSLIIEQLLSLDLNGKSVIDMGTGTGILAILAAMRGAHPVTGIEIDPCAQENAVENVRLNGHDEISILLGDAQKLSDCSEADLFIANINRNIITADLSAYAKALKTGGIMLLSGFYERDIPVVMAAAEPLGLHQLGHTVKGDNWTCLKLTKE